MPGRSRPTRYWINFRSSRSTGSTERFPSQRCRVWLALRNMSKLGFLHPPPLIRPPTAGPTKCILDEPLHLPPGFPPSLGKRMKGGCWSLVLRTIAASFHAGAALQLRTGVCFTDSVDENPPLGAWHSVYSGNVRESHDGRPSLPLEHFDPQSARSWPGKFGK
jgi:hypothetical protein